MNAIEVNHLSFTYPGASRPTLEQVSLEIEKGDFVAIVWAITDAANRRYVKH